MMLDPEIDCVCDGCTNAYEITSKHVDSACADFPIGKMWEHGLREIDMLDVDTEHKPWSPLSGKVGFERRMIEGEESTIRRAYESLRRQGLISYVSFYNIVGDEVEPEWL